MAKIGEGDPRWLVENRTDGKNVNSWHWEEKNITPKGKERLRLILKDVVIPTTDCKELKFTGMDTFKGDMTVANRKGKIMFFYDFNIKINWTGTMDDDTTAKGALELIEVADGDWPDVETLVTVEGDSAASKTLKEIVRKQGITVAKDTLSAFFADIRSQITAKPDSPAASNGSSPAPASPVTSPAATPVASPSPVAVSKTKSTSLTQSVRFSGAPAHILYETFADAGRVSAFTQTACELVAQPGKPFKMFGGNISGEFVEVVPGKKLVQKWRLGGWAPEVFSTVTLEFLEGDSNTCTIKLTQVNIPAAELDRTKAGWDTFFWQRIRGLFGWSYKMM